MKAGHEHEWVRLDDYTLGCVGCPRLAHPRVRLDPETAPLLRESLNKMMHALWDERRVAKEEGRPVSAYNRKIKMLRLFRNQVNDTEEAFGWKE